MLPETLGELLQVSVFVGLVVALVLEKTQWYQDQTSEQKQYIVKWITVVAGVVITIVNLFVPEGMLADANQWYEVAQPLLNMLLYTIGGAYGGSQLTHGVYRWLHRKGNPA